VANSAGSMAKSEVDDQLAQMEKACKSLVRESASLRVPENAAQLQALVNYALNLRAQGVGEYRAGIMGVLNRTDRAAAVGLVSKGLSDLVVSDQLLQGFRGSLDAKLKEAKESAEVLDTGLFVASLDCASSGSVNAYVASISGPPPAASASPAQAMKAYLKSKGTDYSQMSFSVVSESASDPGWKVDAATGPGSKPVYFLLRGANGTWTVIDSAAVLTAEQMKKRGAPADLKAP
jgi:hypothetical protein